MGDAYICEDCIAHHEAALEAAVAAVGEPPWLPDDLGLWKAAVAVAVQAYCEYTPQSGRTHMTERDGTVECPTCHGAGIIPKRRRGYRRMVGRSWMGVVFDTLTGEEVGECRHRHFVSAEEAMACTGLDEFIEQSGRTP